ncbi:MAG TPA: peptidyl-prolyl cis-trans isomerase [Planctomycetota bacterium]|nr:peptidyl-prolyl cis-trans isomerase [Planctomycetota bacterium]
MLAAMLLLGALSAPPQTQNPPTPPQPGAPTTSESPNPSARKPVPQPRRVVLVDEVVATVNDSAILESELRTLAAGEIRRRQAQFGRVSPDVVAMIFEGELERRIDQHRMAQSAKTFGVATPEEVEALFRREVKRDEQDQIRNLGSMTEYSLELERQGRTWQTFEREQRVEKMAQFAEDFSVGMRLRQQSNLYLTPRMLRETYEREKDRFVRPAQAQVDLISFAGANALATANEAAAVWRQEEINSRDLAKRFPDATAIGELLANALVPELAQFALAGPVNNVSPPQQTGREVRLAKVTVYIAARNGQFEDPEVQSELRTLCEQKVFIEFKQQALERAKLRTEVWKSRPSR